MARVQLDLLLFYSMNSFVYIFKIYSNSDNVFMFNWDSIWSTSLDTFVCAFIMCGRWLQISTGVVQHEGSRPRYRRRCSTSATVKRNWPSFRLLIDDISTSPCVVRATQHNNRALPPPLGRRPAIHFKRSRFVFFLIISFAHYRVSCIISSAKEEIVSIFLDYIDDRFFSGCTYAS